MYGLLGDKGSEKKFGEFPIAVSIIETRSFKLKKYLDLLSIRIKVFLWLMSSELSIRSSETTVGYFLILYMNKLKDKEKAQNIKK